MAKIFAIFYYEGCNYRSEKIFNKKDPFANNQENMLQWTNKNPSLQIN